MISESLCKLELKELIGTSFERAVKVYNLKKGEMIFDSELKKGGAIYVVEGRIQSLLYTPEGGEFYINSFEGDICGINFSLFKNYGSEDNFMDIDVVAKEDSVVLSLPFDRVEEMDLEDGVKNQTLKKIALMGMKEHFQHSKYLVYRNVYSNEEFVIKYLEEYENDRIRDTKDLAEVLNISLRSLQRVLKKFYQLGFIENTEGHIRLKDREGMEEYKKKFIK
ncbi:hypothetical protein PM10SUCC1_00020 [Propionigenium maris DSM 9537]|uniref:HTH crp-type domain-containing protein n=1 Tax=Propionigenium maris DSM 9537 TaxID=1123000 RepID=A0A9W6GI56_9FUSO|nr:Crp/Fnr family transcriptional regulator [Propionigenium maris]GLI54487.1 hypothetical protein PM10SUCC1_00020 [Propionigenium maris DSM 9537]